MRSPFIWLLLAIATPGLAQTTDTIRHNVVRLGKVVGKHLSWKKGSNNHYYYFEYNDRGRGPAVTSYSKTDKKGNITLQEITGVDYFKTKVDEKFEVKNGKASWKNKFENESVPYKGELYSNMYGNPGEIELSLNILKNSVSKKVSILPAGTLSYTVVKEEIVKDEKNNSLTIQLIGFSGLGGPPNYNWFTKNGNYFASLSDWTSIIQAGYEKNIDILLPIQKKFEDNFYTSLAKTAIEKSSGGIAIKNVTVFNASEGSTFINGTVLIKDNMIEKVGNSTTKIPAGYKVIDGTNKFLMPGLWEMHGHFSMSDGPLMMAQGVTNLRDMGNGNELWNVKKRVDADSILGPEINIVSGFIDKAGEFAAPTGSLINTLEEGLKYIDDYHKKGCQQIKLYSSINPEWVKPLADKAHGYGMRVCGHIPAFMTASQAIDAGYDEITHLNMLMLNFFGDTVDTRNMTRFKLVGAKGASIDVNGDAVKSFIQKMKDKNITIDPTITVFEAMFTDLPGKVSKVYLPIEKYLPSQTKRNAMSGGFVDDESLAPQYGRSYETMKKFLKALYDNGITILAGTDGGIVQHELEVYSECGIPNYDVLRMATYFPAKEYGLLDKFGTVAPGKIANLILIDGDPKKNIKDIRKIYLTIKEGKIYSPKRIYAAYGWKYYY
ncbi:MAG TPA: amidohydrolase family protein [Chitinophagaceae bacterium]